MAYSLIEQLSRDLDIFFLDNNKIIHLASGCGILPEGLLETDIYNDSVLSTIFQNNLNLEVDINPNLTDILNLDNQGLNNYLVSFMDIAKRGFYTYDKTRLGNNEDFDFHLVAKPKSPLRRGDIFETYKIKQELITSKHTIPDDFTIFNLREFI